MLPSASKFLSIFVTLYISVASAQAGHRRPFFIIAHMVNSLSEIDYYLDRGANAIEADVNFAANGSALNTFHGVPCDCFRWCTSRSDLVDYLRYVRELTTVQEKNLSLLMFDLKIDTSSMTGEAMRRGGADLFYKLVEHLWKDVSDARRTNVLISIPRVDDREFLEGFVRELRKDQNVKYRNNTGFDVGMNSNLAEIASMYEAMGIAKNIWQGDGITNCFSGVRILKRLRQTVALRDSRSGFVHKTYYWTVDKQFPMENILELGVDGMITNHPERLAHLIDTKFSSWYRIATAMDSPWTKIVNLARRQHIFDSLKTSLRSRKRRVDPESAL